MSTGNHRKSKRIPNSRSLLRFFKIFFGFFSLQSLNGCVRNSFRIPRILHIVLTKYPNRISAVFLLGFPNDSIRISSRIFIGFH
jgi:hypothetical protein